MPTPRFQAWQRRALWIALTAACLVGAIFLAAWQSRRSWTYELMGVSTSLGSPIVELNLDSGANGDGYNFSQYAVPESAVKAFMKMATQGNGKFPLIPGYRRDWLCTRWQATPIREMDEAGARFALGGASTELFEATMANLRRSENWYAQCIKRDNGTRISNSELFFFEPGRAVLTTAIVNT